MQYLQLLAQHGPTLRVGHCRPLPVRLSQRGLRQEEPLGHLRRPNRERGRAVDGRPGLVGDRHHDRARAVLNHLVGDVQRSARSGRRLEPAGSEEVARAVAAQDANIGLVLQRVGGGVIDEQVGLIGPEPARADVHEHEGDLRAAEANRAEALGLVEAALAAAPGAVLLEPGSMPGCAHGPCSAFSRRLAGAEGDGQLHGPVVLVYGHAVGPAVVLSAVLAQLIEARGRGVHGDMHVLGPGAGGVQEELEAIVLVDVPILLGHIGLELVGVRVVEDGPDVQGRVVVHHPDFGGLHRQAAAVEQDEGSEPAGGDPLIGGDVAVQNRRRRSPRAGDNGLGGRPQLRGEQHGRDRE